MAIAATIGVGVVLFSFFLFPEVRDHGRVHKMITASVSGVSVVFLAGKRLKQRFTNGSAVKNAPVGIGIHDDRIVFPEKQDFDDFSFGARRDFVQWNAVHTPKFLLEGIDARHTMQFRAVSIEHFADTPIDNP